MIEPPGGTTEALGPAVARRADGAVAPLPPWAVRVARDFIAANLEVPLRLASIAAVTGRSPCHFAKSFKAATGVTPHQYVLRVRVARARQLLATDGAPIADIAYRVGFSSQSHLATIFRRHVGVTPYAFRLAQRGPWGGDDPDGGGRCGGAAGRRDALARTARAQ